MSPRKPKPTEPTSASLLIVIVNYATAELTIDCLASVEQELASLSNTRVVVTDNLSPDDSAEQIAEAIKKNKLSRWCELMRLERNGGFAYGNNAAIRPALAGENSPEFVLLLNPDTVVRPGGIVELMRYMAEHPHVGIAGSRLEDPDGTPQRSAFRFPTVLSELEGTTRFGPVSRLLKRHAVAPPHSDEPVPADWVAGASMMIRSGVFEQVGLLDDDYFMYYEEVDFCIRAHRAGWPCWYVPASRVVHLVGQASGVTDTKRPRKRRPAYWFESRRRYFQRHMGPWRATFADVMWATGHAMWRLRRAIQRKPDNDPPKLLTDFVRHSICRRGPRG